MASLAREIQQTERVLRAEQQSYGNIRNSNDRFLSLVFPSQILFNLIILYSCSRGQVEEITRLFLEAKKRYDDVNATMKSLISLHKVM